MCVGGGVGLMAAPGGGRRAAEAAAAASGAPCTQRAARSPDEASRDRSD